MDEITTGAAPATGAEQPLAAGAASPAAPATADDIQTFLEQYGADLDARGQQSADSGQQPAPGTASGGVTPAAQTADGTASAASAANAAAPPPGPVPYERFSEVNRRAQEAAEQLSRYQAYEGWLDPMAQLAELGVTPDQFAAMVTAARAGQSGQGTGVSGQQGFPQPTTDHRPPTTAPDPAVAYGNWLQQQGIDPGYLDQQSNVMLWNQFQTQQTVAQLAQQNAALQHSQAQAQATAREQVENATWTAHVQAVQAQYPLLKDPELMDAVLNQYEGRYGTAPNQAQFLALAQGFAQKWVDHTKAAVADYAARKGQDGRVPVAAGGSAPPPTDPQVADYHRLSPQKQEELLASYTRSLSGQP